MDDHSCNRLVLTLLRHVLWGDALFWESEVDWEAVHTEMKKQTVSLLVNPILAEDLLPEGLKQKWTMELLVQFGRNEKILWGQDQLLELLFAHEIPVVILKGAAAAWYYPEPEARVQGDVDFLVSGENFERTLKLLLEQGFRQNSPLKENYCEVALEKDQIIFELHRGMNSTHGICAEAVNQYLAEGMQQPVVRTIGDHSFPVLPELCNGLVFLSHMRQHLRSGLGLRQVLDWMLYVARSLDDTVWYQSFQPMAKACGLEQLAIIFTKMCQMYLGLPDTITWCADADETVCRLVMDYILDSGNFGSKREQYSRATQHVLLEKRFFWRMTAGLQKKGLERPLVRKHAFLRPMAWLVQLGHYLDQTLQQGHVIATLREDVRKAKQTRAMLEELRILPDRE